jgi:hypothetical protein
MGPELQFLGGATGAKFHSRTTSSLREASFPRVLAGFRKESAHRASRNPRSTEQSFVISQGCVTASPQSSEVLLRGRRAGTAADGSGTAGLGARFAAMRRLIRPRRRAIYPWRPHGARHAHPVDSEQPHGRCSVRRRSCLGVWLLLRGFLHVTQDGRAAMRHRPGLPPASKLCRNAASHTASPASSEFWLCHALVGRQRAGRLGERESRTVPECGAECRREKPPFFRA